MGRITFTKSHINRGKLINPGWYDAAIKAVKEQESKSGDGSTTFVIDFKIIESGDFEECEVRRYFNEKDESLPYMIPFITVMLGRTPEPGETIDLNDSLIGRQLSIYVNNSEWNNTLKNDAVDFAPLGVKN